MTGVRGRVRTHHRGGRARLAPTRDAVGYGDP